MTRFTEFWRAELTFETVTDVHVGTGERRFMRVESSADGQTDGPEYAVFARAHSMEHDPSSGNICIPGSTLKGALRACAGDLKDQLFGSSPTSSDEGGKGGSLIPTVAKLSKRLNRHLDLPHWDVAIQTWKRIRHARRRDTATVDADQRKLFNTELVPPGVHFSSEVHFFGDGDDLDGIVFPFLKSLALESGFEMGSSRNAMGRVRLRPGTIVFKRRGFEKKASGSGRVRIDVVEQERTVKVVLKPAPQPTSVHFPGPVAILDPERQDTSRKEAKDGGTIQQVLRFEEGRLAGFEVAVRQALRVRCAWLEVTSEWARRDCIDDYNRILRRGETAMDLTATERLFGVTGFRGFLSCHLVQANGKHEQVFPGIALDRLTQGLLYRHTYFFRTPVDVGVDLRIEIDFDRYAIAIPNQLVRVADAVLLRRLIEDVKRRGIKVGRQTSAGFGWSNGFDLGLDTIPTTKSASDG